MSAIIDFTSALSSSLQQIISSGSISLIIAYKIKFLSVSRYLCLFSVLSCLSFTFMSSLILSRHSFLTLILSSFAASIFWDLWMLRSRSHCLSLSSWSALCFYLPWKTIWSLYFSKLLCASTFISKAFSWAFCLSILYISKEPCPNLISGPCDNN